MASRVCKNFLNGNRISKIFSFSFIRVDNGIYRKCNLIQKKPCVQFSNSSVHCARSFASLNFELCSFASVSRLYTGFSMRRSFEFQAQRYSTNTGKYIVRYT